MELYKFSLQGLRRPPTPDPPTPQNLSISLLQQLIEHKGSRPAAYLPNLGLRHDGQSSVRRAVRDGGRAAAARVDREAEQDPENPRHHRGGREGGRGSREVLLVALCEHLARRELVVVHARARQVLLDPHPRPGMVGSAASPPAAAGRLRV